MCSSVSRKVEMNEICRTRLFWQGPSRHVRCPSAGEAINLSVANNAAIC